MAGNILDDIYALLPTIACQRKCGRQICGPIVVFPTEQVRMERAGFPVTLNYLGANLQCSYYNAAKDGCRVHAARPLICRLWGMVQDPKMICPFGCRPTRWVTNAEVAGWLNRLTALDGAPRLAPESGYARR